MSSPSTPTTGHYTFVESPFRGSSSPQLADSDSVSQTETHLDNVSTRPSSSGTIQALRRPKSSGMMSVAETAVGDNHKAYDSQSEEQDEEHVNDEMAEKVDHLPHHKAHDPDLVEWDGPHDPENPQNFSFMKKAFLTGLIIALTINVTFASSSPSTATLAIAEEFNASSEVTILVTSLFLVGYVIGPIFWSGLSETYGRRPVFVVTLFLYTISILGQSLGKNLATILVTRFFGGLFASAPLTNGGGFLVDIWDAVGRGPAVAIFSASVFLGPIVGPIVGGFVVPSRLGWRWDFWILMIFSGVCWVLCALFLPETFHPVLLQRRAKRLRKADPVKNANKYAAFDKQDTSFGAILQRTLFRPFHMLLLEPILVLITIYTGIVYGLIYALFELFPIVFNETRQIPPQFAGLFFIGTGIGTSLGALYTYIEGRKYVGLTKKWHGSPPPEQRLNGAMVGGPLLVIAIFWVGWTGAYKQVHWIVPQLGTIPLGMGIALIFICFINYLVDTYLMYAASALAANSIIRSAAGAAFPLFTNQMFHNLGIQWGATLLGLLALLLAPMPFVFYKYGAWIRTKSRFAPCIDLKIKDMVLEEERKEKAMKEGKSVESV